MTNQHHERVVFFEGSALIGWHDEPVLVMALPISQHDVFGVSLASLTFC
jgi:hypothetical protein